MISLSDVACFNKILYKNNKSQYVNIYNIVRSNTNTCTKLHGGAKKDKQKNKQKDKQKKQKDKNQDNHQDKYLSKLYAYEKGNAIIQFIENSKLEKIIEELPNMLYDTSTFCDKIIGQGMMGQVYIPGNGSTAPAIKLGNRYIELPIVIKRANVPNYFSIKIIDDKLYIWAYRNLTTELLILIYTNQLWYEKRSPNLPLMLGWGLCKSCDCNMRSNENPSNENPSTNDEKILINHIITERHGLDKEIEIKLDGYYEDPIWHPNQKNNIFKSNIATLRSLITYLLFTNHDDRSRLPNGIEVNIVKLLDQLTIQYLVTHSMLSRNNITIADMHSDNLFIHWLNEKSYMGDEMIGRAKYIIYEYQKGKYIKVKTYGLLLKIGDVGGSIVRPRKNVYILGQANELETNYHIVDQIITPNNGAHWFLYFYRSNLPLRLAEKTLAYKILSKYPYSELQVPVISDKQLEDMLTPIEMLNKYATDYMIDADKIKDLQLQEHQQGDGSNVIYVKY
jgi:hypothetical protein